MQIIKTTSYEIKFQVRAFWNEEGGMGEEGFGDITDTIEEAIYILELAKRTESFKNMPWIITCDVKVQNKKGKSDATP